MSVTYGSGQTPCSLEHYLVMIIIRDVTEPANIRVRRMRISCAKSVGFGCGCGFVARSKLPATIVTVSQLSYLKFSSCK